MGLVFGNDVITGPTSVIVIIVVGLSLEIDAVVAVLDMGVITDTLLGGGIAIRASRIRIGVHLQKYSG